MVEQHVKLTEMLKWLESQLDVEPDEDRRTMLRAIYEFIDDSIEYALERDY